MAAARIDIEGQHDACYYCPCSPPQLRMQEQMPAQLLGPVGEAAWQDFITKANGVLADMSDSMRWPMMAKLIASSLGLLLMIVGLVIFSTSNGESLIPLFVCVFGGLIVFGGSSCFFDQKMVAIANEHLEALKRVCAQATDANPGVSFIVMAEFKALIMGNRCREVRKNYVEVSVVGSPVTVAMPAAVIMAQAFGQPHGGGGAKFCPNCGNPC
eukprot:CAMPEP_0179170450 /NCGR_PEP_ID=MMETSP0796-20121207/83970_1 /TAXON_ID=73915 /ORGANISM="Pyrodinium bahamense, Strain pbaha01" /LENGTH=212 /DNA_ID=CAMNT_0020873429 /DNA_START=47 /DNA_END=682 /DNA_ORIENTATION=-